MPPVISLLSSSPEPHALKPKAKTAINKPLAKPATLKTKAARNDICMISDDEGSMLPKPLAKGSKNLDSNANAKFSLPPLSSDNDPYTLPSPKSFESVKPKMTTNSAKKDRDFFYNSDDFDSTVNLDTPPTEPAAKKARTSTSNLSLLSSKAKQASNPLDKTKTPMKSAAYKRSYSNIDSTRQTADFPKMKRSNTTGSKKALELDPLIFTSSPDPYLDAIRKRTEKRKGNTSTGQGFSLDSLPELSSDTDLPDLKSTAISSKARPEKALSAFEQYEADRQKEKTEAAKRNGKAKKDVGEDAEKATKALVKEAEKEKKLQAKADKLREKEEKVKEKESAAAVAKVNTLRTDKKVSGLEMIVDLASVLDSKLTTPTKVFLDAYNIEHSQWESPLPVVKFRRKVNAIWNEDLSQYEPVARHIKNEKHIMYIMYAQEFVDLVVCKDERNDLNIFVPKLESQFEGCKIIILIQGYNIFLRKNRNIQNRKFTQAVRGEEAPTASQRKKKEPEYVDEDVLERALLRLQMNHGILIHHTSVVSDTAEQLMVFAQNISLIPYKTQKQPNGTTFCMESGQVKTGIDPADTYVKMLQEMVRVTAAVAYGIVDKYPTVRELVAGLKENGPLDLQDCNKGSNKNGGFTDSRVGPAISKRVYKVFTLRDPDSFDV